MFYSGTCLSLRLEQTRKTSHASASRNSNVSRLNIESLRFGTWHGVCYQNTLNLLQRSPRCSWMGYFRVVHFWIHAKFEDDAMALCCLSSGNTNLSPSWCQHPLEEYPYEILHQFGILYGAYYLNGIQSYYMVRYTWYLIRNPIVHKLYTY